MKRIALQISILFFLLFCFFIFLKGLNNENNYTPNERIGKKISSFKAKKFFNNEEIHSEELFNNNEIYLLNIWSSWCAPCRDEHDILMKLNKSNMVKIIGLNYKDNLNNANKYIDSMGNPYFEIIKDEDGTISIELGAYGVPETFVIDKNNIIIKKFVGPLTSKSLKEIMSIVK